VVDREIAVSERLVMADSVEKLGLVTQRWDNHFVLIAGAMSDDGQRLRGLSGAKDEFLLTATAQNLRRMAKYLGTGPPGNREMVPI